MEFRNNPIPMLRKDIYPNHNSLHSQNVLRGWTSGVHARHISDAEVLAAKQRNFLSPNYSRNKGI